MAAERAASLHGMWDALSAEEAQLCASLSSYTKSGGGEIVDNPSIYLAGGQSGLSIGVCLIGVEGVAVFHAEAFSGGAGLDGNNLVGQISLAGDGAALCYNDDLCSIVVRIGEQHVLLTGGSDGDAGNTHIILGSLHTGQNGVEIHLLDIQLYGDDSHIYDYVPIREWDQIH